MAIRVRGLLTNSPLERKLPVLICALLVIVVAVFCAATYFEMRRAAIESARLRLRTVATQLADMSAAGQSTRAQVLTALAADTVLHRALAGGTITPEQLANRAVAAGLRQDSTVQAWELWTSDGELRVATASGTTRDAAMLAATLALAGRADSARYSPFYAADSLVYSWITLPIVARGAVVGVLAERRRLANNRRAEQQIRELIGEEVTLLVTNTAHDLWTSLSGRVQGGIPAVPTRDASFVTTIDGEERLGARATVRGTPWVFVLTLPMSDVLAPPMAFLQRLLLIGALVLLLGAVGAWWLGRHAARPLRAMTIAAEHIADGKTATLVQAAGGDEVARLAGAFNRMAVRVGEAHAALATRNASLTAANEAKSRFLAMMSHELRTPLNAIGGYTELLELGLRGPVTEAQIEDLGRIRRNRDHLLTIINTILTFAQAEAGKLPITLSDVDMADLIGHAEAHVGPQLAAKHLQYHVVVEDGTCTARADREKLQQILLNLLANAIRHTPHGGHITVRCARHGEWVSVSVEDTGSGIPADRLHSIFEPFVQADTSLTREVGGTGLGLSISRELAQAMGGDLTAVSEVGKGSTFTVQLRPSEVAVAPPAHRARQSR